MMRFLIPLLFLIPAFLSFRSRQPKVLTYLPLGDSYTIGTGASEEQAWPSLLSRHLNAQKISCRLLDNPARNGFSTEDLIREELPLVKKLNPDFVTLLIGVNDWVRNVSKETFEKNLKQILDEVQAALKNKRQLLLVTIPDFGVTPQGKLYGRGRDIGKGISEFNAIIRQQAQERNLPLADIFDLSKKMGSDNSLVAVDGLHPSAKEYEAWEELILKEALKVLK